MAIAVRSDRFAGKFRSLLALKHNFQHQLADAPSTEAEWILVAFGRYKTYLELKKFQFPAHFILAPPFLKGRWQHRQRDADDAAAAKFLRKCEGFLRRKFEKICMKRLPNTIAITLLDYGSLGNCPGLYDCLGKFEGL